MKIIILLPIFILAACGMEDMSSGGDIDAIYWHENDRYTIMTINSDIVTKHRIPPWNGYGGTIELYQDVDPDNSSWYKCDWKYNSIVGFEDGYCEIHIHNLNELGTADWNHGKFGSGSTKRID